MRFNALLAGSILFAAAQLHATPVYYLFEGSVTASNAPDYAVGMQIKYLFMADVALGGTINSAGSMDPVDDIGSAADDVYYDFFLADFTAGTAFADDGTGTPVWNRFHHYYGYNLVEFGASSSQLVGSNMDESGYDFVSVLREGAVLSDWSEGQSGFLGFNLSHDDAGRDWDVRSDLYLCSVSSEPPVASVPEPAAAWLLLGGLPWLAWAGRRPLRG